LWDSEDGTTTTDLLEQVDEVFRVRAQQLQASAEQQARAGSTQARLHDDVAALCTQEIRAAMEAFLVRLRTNGGGGLLEERAGIAGTGVAPRMRLWMSLSGEILGRPRQDRNPYLQLDFEMTTRQITVAEGDMWQGHGAAGRVGAWDVSEVTNVLVTRALLAVLQRAAL